MVKNAFKEVFRRPSYVLLFGVVALLIFAFAVWLPNMRLLLSLTLDSTVPMAVKFSFPIRLFESIATNFTMLSASYTIAIALLTGVNVALIVYYVKRQKQRLFQSGVTVGALGIVSGAWGMGCAACGSLILTSLLGTAGGLGVIAFLPLRGGEFGILGVALLGTAMYLLSKQINKPIVCEVPLQTYEK